MKYQGCSFAEDGAQRAASKRLAISDGPIGFGENARGLLRSASNSWMSACVLSRAGMESMDSVPVFIASLLAEDQLLLIDLILILSVFNYNCLNSK
jgi:hypothetical protein